jgi:penicillin-binding protein 1B
MKTRFRERLAAWGNRLRRIPRKPVLYVLCGLAVILFSGWIWIDRSIVRRFETRTKTLPSRVYARPFTMTRGARLDAAALVDQLRRLSYDGVPAEPESPGEYRRDGNDWTIYLRSAVTPHGRREALPVALDVSWRRLRRITHLKTGSRLDSFSLEPEPLVTFYADVMEERRWTPLKEIPLELRQAVEVVEDHRFRRHHGVDLISIARAFTVNVRSGRVVQGGSTITQQLVKNLYGPQTRNLRRKLLEAVASVALELHYDKDAILEAYLNEVYLGQLGPVAISGVGDASRFYFGSHVRDVDLPQSASLAGMIRNPGGYNPRLHPQRVRERRDLVLRLMHEHGKIDEPRLRAAMAASIEVVEASLSSGRLPWIEDYLGNAIAPVAPEAIPSRAGYSIFTTFDPAIQHAAREALQSGLEQLERRIAHKDGDPLEGAIVVLRPSDGAVLALIGGRNHGRSQFNRAIRARRSPGSTFKPFVFLAGLERARRDPEFDFTVATVFDDAPLELKAGGELWHPANYDRRFRGAVPVRQAVEQSINVPTVRAAMQAGLENVVEMAKDCGIDSELQAIPSLALGAEEVTPLELATAYATLANGGRRVRPHGLESLIDKNGIPYDLPSHAPEPVLEPQLAYLMTDVLEGVFERGTARSAAKLGFAGVAAGKTGSSDGLRDAWFVGYTPEVLALVWVGYDDNRPVGLTGAAAALPIWVDLMRRIGADDADPFPRPAGVVRVRVDPTTGQRAARGCPSAREEIFVRGTEPEEHCTRHGGKKRRRGFWKRLTGQ